MKLRIVLAILILSFSLYGCGGGAPNTDKKAEPAKTPATKATESAKPVETAKPEPAKTPAAESAKFKDPEEFIKAFMKSYQAGNKAEVEKYVTEGVLKKLRFGAGPIEDLNYQGCNEEKGNINCAYTYGGGSMSFTIKKDPASGYKITGYEETAD